MTFTQLTSKSFKHLMKDLGVSIFEQLIDIQKVMAIEVFFKTLKYEHLYIQDRYENVLQAGHHRKALLILVRLVF